LMWDPGFIYEEKKMAIMAGVERALCMYSFSMRGTPTAPGIVLGIEEKPTAWCRGCCFRVATTLRRDVFDILQQRENQPSRCYRAVVRAVALEGGDEVAALVFLPILTHEQYAGHLSPSQRQAILHSDTRGLRGTSLEYLQQTLQCLKEMGIQEPGLEQFLRKREHEEERG